MVWPMLMDTRCVRMRECVSTCSLSHNFVCASRECVLACSCVWHGSDLHPIASVWSHCACHVAGGLCTLSVFSFKLCPLQGLQLCIGRIVSEDVNFASVYTDVSSYVERRYLLCHQCMSAASGSSCFAIFDACFCLYVTKRISAVTFSAYACSLSTSEK